eukprot:gnl/Trimastix_PCT/3632.p1 GENE.gnl/Trimastix_PCT/3632~~gnl/Trimastix_PCT/3632.p1  ORF type:complete len:961 (-),score=230.18 gnl/Trimastix_PCT/3632:364-3153(-)
MLLGGVLAVQISSVEFVSHQLTQSLHAQTISVLNEQLSIPKGAARMLAEDFLCRQYHARGPPYDGTLPAMVTYAQRYPGLSILVIFGKEGTMFELRKETVDGPTNLVEMTRPPTYLREHHRLHLAESNRTAPYVSYSYLRTTAQRTFGPNETWWQGEAIPKEGNWMLMTWLDRAILLCYSAKIMYNGTFEGVVYADYTLQALVHILRNIHLGEGGKLAIIDNLDRLIASSSLKDDKLAQRVDTLPRADNATDRAIADAAKFLFSRRAAGTTVVHGTTHSIGAGGKTYVLSTGNMVFDSAKNTNWTVLLLLPRATFFAASDNGMIFSVAAVAVFFVCSFLISVTLVSAVSRHIRRIIGQVDSVVTLRDPHFDDISTARSNSPRFLRVSEVQKLQDSVTRMKMILQSFEKYIPVELLKYLISANRPAELGLERATASVMFLDVVGFTSIMERVPIPELIEQFTEYCNEAISTIIENNGTLDKMMGDGMMAFFGCPPTILRDHQYWAARCALHLQRAMVRMRAKWVKEGHVPFKIRIGLASGNVSVGNVGSQTRFQYTVLGDVVNLASRLEGINKYFHTSILATGHTFEALDQERFVGRQLATIKVKGRTHRTRLYELVTSAEMFSKEFCSSRDLTASQQHLSTGRIMDTGRSSMDEAPALDPNLPSAHSTPTPTHAFLPREMNESLDSHDLITPTSCAPLSLPDSARSADFGSPRAASVQLTMPNGTDWPEQSESASVHDLEELMTASSSHNPLRHDPLFLVDLPQPIKVAPGILRRCAHLCMLFTRAVRCYESKRFRDAARLLNYYRSAEHKSMRRDLHVLEEEFYSQHHKPLPSPSTPHLTPESAANATTHIAQNPILPSSHNAPSVSHQLSFSVINAFQESSLSQRVHTLDFMEGTDYAWELLKRCEDLAQCEVIPEDWDPVITMTEK